MTHPSDPPPATDGIAFASHPLFRAVLLWSGAILCAVGIVWNRMWEHWAGGRFAELLVLSLASLVLAGPVRRLVRCSWATTLAGVWGAALLVFAGALPVASVALVALATATAGRLVAGPMPAALTCTCSLTLLGGVLGWLPPLPTHSRWSHLALCATLVVIGRRDLKTQLRALRAGWCEAVVAGAVPPLCLSRHPTAVGSHGSSQRTCRPPSRPLAACRRRGARIRLPGKRHLDAADGCAAAKHRAATAADTDPSGHLWLDLLHRQGMREVILHPASLKPAQAAGLRLAGTRRQAVAGEVEWWQLPTETSR